MPSLRLARLVPLRHDCEHKIKTHIFTANRNEIWFLIFFIWWNLRRSYGSRMKIKAFFIKRRCLRLMYINLLCCKSWQLSSIILGPPSLFRILFSLILYVSVAKRNILFCATFFLHLLIFCSLIIPCVFSFSYQKNARPFWCSQIADMEWEVCSWLAKR